MESMSEMPDNPIAKLQSLSAEHRVEDAIERYDLAIFDIITDLPTY